MRIKIKSLHRCTMFFLIVCVASLLPIAAIAQPPGTETTDTQSDPKIVFESQVHDFGTVKPKTSLTHEFVFKNNGTAELLIEKIKAG